MSHHPVTVLLAVPGTLAAARPWLARRWDRLWSRVLGTTGRYPEDRFDQEIGR